MSKQPFVSRVIEAFVPANATLGEKIARGVAAISFSATLFGGIAYFDHEIKGYEADQSAYTLKDPNFIPYGSRIDPNTQVSDVYAEAKRDFDAATTDNWIMLGGFLIGSAGVTASLRLEDKRPEPTQLSVPLHTV